MEATLCGGSVNTGVRMQASEHHGRGGAAIPRSTLGFHFHTAVPWIGQDGSRVIHPWPVMEEQGRFENRVTHSVVAIKFSMIPRSPNAPHTDAGNEDAVRKVPRSLKQPQ